MAKPGPDYDVVIVGASIAGCRAALTLAERRLRVLVVDRCRFPRWKPCAGGVTFKAGRYIHDALKPRLELAMRGAYLTFGPQSVHVRSDQPLGWMVHRETFDADHVELVRSQPGVEVALGTAVHSIREEADAVNIETTGSAIRTRAVIGADGVESLVSRGLARHDTRQVGVAFEGEARFSSPDLVEDVLFDFRGFRGGYGWVFPKTDHYSIGGYICGPTAVRIRDLYDDFVAQTPCLRSTGTYRTRGHRIPLGGIKRPLNSARTVVAGDAADLADPLTGEGIYYALRSGHLAAETIADFLATGRPLDGYTRTIHGEMLGELRYARRLARIVYARPSLAYRLLTANHSAALWLMEVLAGRRTYQAFWRRLVRELPLRLVTLPFRRSW